jgi:protein tyrosine phosphatase (PTP) superfamily phosphohydrolase (DUF442 family)
MANRSRRSWSRVGLIAIAAVAALLWFEVLQPMVFPKRWGTIVPEKLYRSGQVSARLIQNLVDRHGIQMIIDLSEERPDDPDQKAEVELARKLGIEHHRFPLSGDGRGEFTIYVEAIRLTCDAMKRNRPVLVHCASGSQRIGGFTAVYRLLVETTPPAAVLSELKRFGWRPKKDQVLLVYLNESLPLIAEGLVEKGVLDKAPQPVPKFAIP